MTNQQIIDYFNKYKNTYPLDQLKQTLLSAGWPQQEVDEAFRAIQTPQQTTSPAPQSTQQNTQASTPFQPKPFTFNDGADDNGPHIPNPTYTKQPLEIWAVLALVFSWLPLIGFLLGIISLIRINKKHERGQALAITAIIINIFFIILGGIIVTTLRAIFNALSLT